MRIWERMLDAAAAMGQLQGIYRYLRPPSNAINLGLTRVREQDALGHLLQEAVAAMADV